MKKKQKLQYTIRQVPDRVDMVLREKADKEKTSLNDTALGALAKGLGLADDEVRYHDLDDLAGTWVDDPKVEKALKEMDRVDPGLWK
ncbi:MAG: hypothetical protein V1873_02930 [Verrucomicrobiota bacterium]